MTAEEIEAMAKGGNLSSFEGGGMAGISLYTGMNDDLVDFAGDAASFLHNQTESGRIFTVNINNKTGTDRKIVLIPGYTSDGRPTGALTFTDGVNDYGFGAGLTLDVSGDPKSYQNFIDFIKWNPTVIHGLKFRAANSANQIEQTLTLRPLSPFKDLESVPINLSTYTNEDTYKDKVVTVPREMTLSNQQEVIFTILSGENLTISFYAGAVLNTTAALDKKRKAAKSSAVKIAGMSPAQVQQAMKVGAIR